MSASTCRVGCWLLQLLLLCAVSVSVAGKSVGGPDAVLFHSVGSAPAQDVAVSSDGSTYSVISTSQLFAIAASSAPGTTPTSEQTWTNRDGAADLLGVAVASSPTGGDIVLLLTSAYVLLVSAPSGASGSLTQLNA